MTHAPFMTASRRDPLATIVLSGGEPTLHPQFFDFVDYLLRGPHTASRPAARTRRRSSHKWSDGQQPLLADVDPQRASWPKSSTCAGISAELASAVA